MSPVTGLANSARASVSDDGWLAPAGAPTGAATNDGKEHQHAQQQQQKAEGEIGRLKKEIETLQHANTVLTEKLVEANLEATALRRTSIEHGQAMLDWGTRGRRYSSWSSPDLSGMMGPSPNDTDEADVCQDGVKEASNHRLGSLSGCVDNKGLVNVNRDAGDEDGRPPREEEVHVDQKPAKQALVDKQEEMTSSYGGEEKITTLVAAAAGAAAAAVTAAATAAAATSSSSSSAAAAAAPSPPPPATAATDTPASSHRRLSSSAFKDAEEQTELIEALRGQVAQLRLEVQATKKAANPPSARGEGPAGGPARHRSNCSSDDDSEESSGDDGEKGTNRNHSNRDKSAEGKGRPRSSPPKQSFEEGAFGKGRDGPREQSGGGGGGDLESGSDFRGVEEDPVQSLLRERVNALTAELTAAKSALGALREQAQQSQAASMELQRELLRLQRTRDDSSMVAAAVARASAETAVRAGAYTAHRDPGGVCGEEEERRSNCLNYSGLSWLHRLWRTMFCGGGNAMGSGMDSRICDEDKMSGSGGICGERGDDVGVDRPGRRRERATRRSSANERKSLLGGT